MMYLTVEIKTHKTKKQIFKLKRNEIKSYLSGVGHSFDNNRPLLRLTQQLNPPTKVINTRITNELKYHGVRVR